MAALRDRDPAVREGAVAAVLEQRLLPDEAAVFLDAAGDVKAAVAALSLHRSGVYYRLHRIEELTGLDLGRGEDRLLVQLAIRLLRLA